MAKRPLLYAVLAFLLGHISIIFQDIALWLLITFALIIVLIIAGLRQACSRKLACLLLVLFLLGSVQRYTVDDYNTTALPLQLDQADVEASGIITSEVEIDGNMVRFTFQAKELFFPRQDLPIHESETFAVQLTLQEQSELEQASIWRRGLNIALQGTITIPAEANNKGMFDYRQYLQRKGIHWLWKSKGSSSLQIMDSNWHYSSLLHQIDLLRKRMAAPLDQLYNEVESGYLKGLILGIREDLDPEQFRSFSTLGLTHILAISGLHVAVFMYIVTTVLKWMRCSKEQIISLLLLAIPCYVAITGASPSVLRAGMMAMLGLLAARAGRLKDGLHIIAIVAALLVLWKPYLLHDVSFQLSFVVTLGLIVGVPAVQRLLPQTTRWKWLIDLFSVTVVAQIISFPLSIYYFNQFHLLSLAANFFLVPFISMIVMPLSSISLFIGHISLAAAKPISSIVHWCNELTFVIVEMLSKVNQLYTIWATPSIYWILLWYGIWFYLFTRWRRIDRKPELSNSSDRSVTEPIDGYDELSIIYPQQQKSWLQANKPTWICLLLAGLLLVYGYAPQMLDRNATISFLDVGQGDASLIRTPTGKMLLIDGGGTIQFGQQEEWKQRRDPFEVGKKVLLPLLMKRGVHQLDAVIISHLDSDHIGGLIEIIKMIPVKEIWWNGSYKQSSEAEQLFQLIMEKGIALRTPIIGEQINIDRYTTIDVLWPLQQLPSAIYEEEQQNEQSLVFMLTLYKTTLLYTGDVGSSTEESIINEHRMRVEEARATPLPPIDIMKAAHHGSRYSTDYSWLSFVQPRTTVISAGRNNVYGHPHPDVLGRLSQYQSLVWRTDLQGEVQFIVDPKRSYYVKWN